ncbi:hypothetical protein PPSIR1_02331 [Plesiocystis pacifica SIR-1]|uniref:Uncharacterized protein n=1 Tax=Plesiocystis pacifica SIR-1 TaxID=391625 RepID=A6G430_9BACT|nr:hypothetical protein [Plesiocystis pacifica]EDM79353.1 hypothetical protein PPSIR1_02331 [Plesiocystis pacifica SIR-1]
MSCADDSGTRDEGFGEVGGDELGPTADTDTAGMEEVGETADTSTDADTTADESTEESTDDTDTDTTEESTDETDTTQESTEDTTEESTDTTEESTESSSESTTGNDCLECGVTLDSTQSSSFSALPGTEFLGSATLQGDQIIYALDEVGSGRVIYTADTNLLYEEITDCPLWEWLGQSGDQLPKVLSFGRYLCGGLGNNLGSYPDLTYAGDNLPAQYVNDPAALAADYDAVIYCTLASTPAAEAATIVEYVQDHGGGLYLASEYWGFINQGDLDTINTIANPLGVEFEATNLDWGQANGDIAFECFPDPQ